MTLSKEPQRYEDSNGMRRTLGFYASNIEEGWVWHSNSFNWGDNPVRKQTISKLEQDGFEVKLEDVIFAPDGKEMRNCGKVILKRKK